MIYCFFHKYNSEDRDDLFQVGPSHEQLYGETMENPVNPVIANYFVEASEETAIKSIWKLKFYDSIEFGIQPTSFVLVEVYSENSFSTSTSIFSLCM